MTRRKHGAAGWSTGLLMLAACHGSDGGERAAAVDGAEDAGQGADSARAPGADPVTTGQTPPLGPTLFGDAPYARRPLPVRRLALGGSDDALCVILADRTLHCENSGTDISARVPDNHGFVSVSAASGSDHYAALRGDGSTAIFHQFLAAPVEHALPAGRYIDLWSQGAAACGLREDGAVRCSAAYPPTALPAGPFVQIAGDYEQGSFLGLRVDGVLVSSVRDHLSSLEGERPFSDFDGTQRIPGCARDSEGSLVCFDYGADDAVTFAAQPDGDLRDYAQYAGQVCTVTQDGRAACRAAEDAGAPSHAPADARFVDIETRGRQTCGVTEAGALLCWEGAGDVREVALPMPAAVD